MLRATTTPTTTTTTASTINIQDPSTISSRFPVLSQLNGIDWKGECRCTDGNFQPASSRLTGGIRYDLMIVVEEKDINTATSTSATTACTTATATATAILTSFVTFPNGKTRTIQMRGTPLLFQEQESSTTTTTWRLDPVLPEGGPIYMILKELAPDTLLVNEYETATDQMVLTSSLSIVAGGDSLVQVSHEIGDTTTSATNNNDDDDDDDNDGENNTNNNNNIIWGHQVWRFEKTRVNSSSEMRAEREPRIPKEERDQNKAADKEHEIMKEKLKAKAALAEKEQRIKDELEHKAAVLKADMIKATNAAKVAREKMDASAAMLNKINQQIQVMERRKTTQGSPTTTPQQDQSETKTTLSKQTDHDMENNSEDGLFWITDDFMNLHFCGGHK